MIKNVPGQDEKLQVDQEIYFLFSGNYKLPRRCINFYQYIKTLVPYYTLFMRTRFIRAVRLQPMT